VIQSIRHKGLRRFHATGSTAGIQTTLADMDIPGFRLHALVGADRGRWSIWVNGNWRLTFEFRNGNVYVLDYEDYH